MKTEVTTPSPLKSIRKKCLDCCSNKRSLVRRCEIADCPLHFYRSGHNPRRRGISRIKHPGYSTGLMKSPNPTASSGGNVPNTKVTTPSAKTCPVTGFNTELEHVLSRVTNLIQENTTQLIDKVKTTIT